MSKDDDVTTPDEPTADEAKADPTKDETSPKVDKPAPSTPASRARRIGGRPLPGPGKAAAAAGTETDEPAAVKRSAAKAAPATTSTTAAKTKTKAAKAVAKTKAAAATDDDADNEKKKSKKAKAPRDAEQTLARLRWVPAGVLAAAAVAAAVFCVVLGHGVWWAKKSVSAQRDQVLAAAKTCVGSITNYDYRKLAASEQAGLACTTGTFQAQYKQAMDTVVAKLAPQTQTVQTFQVAEAGIESVSADGKQWVVLVYGQQAVTNADTGPTSPRQDILTAQVTLNKVDGQWRVAALKRL